MKTSINILATVCLLTPSNATLFSAALFFFALVVCLPQLCVSTFSLARSRSDDGASVTRMTRSWTLRLRGASRLSTRSTRWGAFSHACVFVSCFSVCLFVFVSVGHTHASASTYSDTHTHTHTHGHAHINTHLCSQTRTTQTHNLVRSTRHSQTQRGLAPWHLCVRV